MRDQVLEAAAARLEITNRFLDLRQVLHLNQVSYARLFGLSKQGLSQLELNNGRSKMNLPTILMVGYILKEITHNSHFFKFDKEQQEKVLELQDMIFAFVNRNTINKEDIEKMLYNL